MTLIQKETIHTSDAKALPPKPRVQRKRRETNKETSTSATPSTAATPVTPSTPVTPATTTASAPNTPNPPNESSKPKKKQKKKAVVAAVDNQPQAATSFSILPLDLSSLPPNLAVIYKKVCRLLSLRSADSIVQKLCSILDPQTRKHKYSLRTIEFFLTEYTMQHSSHDTSLQMIYESYQRLVNSYSKKHFDCFARDVRVPVSVAGKTIQTTPAQLHFLQWFFDQSIDVEIEQRVNDIRSEMKQKATAKESRNNDAKGANGASGANGANGTNRTNGTNSTRVTRSKKQDGERAEKFEGVRGVKEVKGVKGFKEEAPSASSLSTGELRLYAKQVERLRANLRRRVAARGGGGAGGSSGSSLPA